MSNKTKISVQIGSFPTLLTIAFIVLKLCKVIAWSWWWVLSPLWIPVAVIVFGIFTLFLCFLIFD